MRPSREFVHRAIVATLLLFAFVQWPSAQTAVPVPAAPSTPGGFGALGAVIIVFVVIAAAAYFYLRKHNAVLTDLTAALHLNTQATKGNSAAVATTIPAVVTVPPAAPAPSQPAPVVAAPSVTPAQAIAAGTVAPPAAPQPAPAQVPPAVAAAPASSQRNPLSNAPAGYADTSPEGYALWYALGKDNAPVGAPRLIYDGNTFGSIAEITAYQAAVAQRNINLAAYRVPVWKGEIAATSLSLDDWCWVLRHSEVAWQNVIGGDYDYIRGQINHAFYNGNAAFQPASYNGPLKGFAS